MRVLVLFLMVLLLGIEGNAQVMASGSSYGTIYNASIEEQYGDTVLMLSIGNLKEGTYGLTIIGDNGEVVMRTKVSLVIGFGMMRRLYGKIPNKVVVWNISSPRDNWIINCKEIINL